MININILVLSLMYEQKHEKILQKKKIQSFYWKTNSPVYLLASKVKRQTMAIADSHLDLLRNFHHSSSSRSKIQSSECCLKPETILLEHKTETTLSLLFKSGKRNTSPWLRKIRLQIV